MRSRVTARGFTLIELLVVIAIIGMLSSVVLASLNGARVKARDARRLADLRQIQTALELYYSTTNNYPAHAGNTEVTSSLGTVLAPTYISVVPKDPLDPGSRSSPYNYRYCTDGQSYALLMDPEARNSWCSIINGTTGGAAPCGWQVYAACTATGT